MISIIAFDLVEVEMSRAQTQIGKRFPLFKNLIPPFSSGNYSIGNNNETVNFSDSMNSITGSIYLKEYSSPKNIQVKGQAEKSFEVEKEREHLEEKSSEALFRLLESNKGEMCVSRMDVLKELVERGEPALEGYLARNLSTPGIEGEWLFALILATENIDIFKEKNRKVISKELLRHALALRDAPDETSQIVLWSAVRRSASLIPVTEASELLAFLRPEDRRATRQVALQALINILTVEPLHPKQERLLNRVTELAEKYLDPDWLISPENRVMAWNAFGAAALAGSQKLPSLTDRLVKLNEKRLVERCRELISQALSQRTDRDIQNLKTCLSRLNGAE